MFVHTLWIGKELPLLQQLALKSWLDYGFDVKLFVYDDVANVPQGVQLLDGRDVLSASKICTYKTGKDKGSPSLFANLFRYEYLFRNGGSWIDADTVCLSSQIPTAFPYIFSSESFSPNDPRVGHANFAFVKVPVSSALMRDCLHDANKGYQDAAWGTIGPKLLSRHINRLQLRQYVLPARAYCPLPYTVAQRIFHTPAWKPSSESLGIHLWNQILVRRGISRNKRGPEGCFLAKLLDKHLPA